MDNPNCVTDVLLFTKLKGDGDGKPLSKKRSTEDCEPETDEVIYAPMLEL